MNSTKLTLEAIGTMAVEARKLSEGAQEMNSKAQTHAERIREISRKLAEASNGFMALGHRLKMLGHSQRAGADWKVIENTEVAENTFDQAA